MSAKLRHPKYALNVTRAVGRGHLVVIGRSYIGLEFAQINRRLGAEVKGVEKGPRLMGREDPEIFDAIRELLQGEGIVVRTNAECIRFRKHGEGVVVGVDCKDGEPEVIGSDILLAVGRKSNTGGLGLNTLASRWTSGMYRRRRRSVDERSGCLGDW